MSGYDYNYSNHPKSGSTQFLIVGTLLIIFLCIITFFIKYFVKKLQTQRSIDETYLISTRQFSEPKTYIPSHSTTFSSSSSFGSRILDQRRRSSSSIHLSRASTEGILRPSELPKVEINFINDNDLYETNDDYNSQYNSIYYYQMYNNINSPSDSRYEPLTFDIDPYVPHSSRAKRYTFTRHSSSLIKAPERISERTPERMSERTPERMFERTGSSLMNTLHFN